MSIIVFDTETTGVPHDYKKSVYDEAGNWPDLVSISWIVYRPTGAIFKKASHIIRPDGWTVPKESTAIHGITHAHASADGDELHTVLGTFALDLLTCKLLVAHNMNFDINVVRNALYWRLHLDPQQILNMPKFCTMMKSTAELKLPAKNPNSKSFKWPGLDELYRDTFYSEPPSGAHESMRDAEVCGLCYWARWSHLTPIM